MTAKRKPAPKRVRSATITGARLQAREKQRKALELRKAGAPYRVIAEQVGYSDASGARKAVIAAFEEVIQEPAKELRSIQVERLNQMLLVLWPKVQKGDEQSINTALRVMEKMDLLMGTNSPEEVVHKHEGVLVIEGSKDEYIAALVEMAGADPKEIEARPSPSTDLDIIEAEVVEDSLVPVEEEALSYVEDEQPPLQPPVIDSDDEDEVIYTYDSK
jgi:hypothetical protein